MNTETVAPKEAPATPPMGQARDGTEYKSEGSYPQVIRLENMGADAVCVQLLIPKEADDAKDDVAEHMSDDVLRYERAVHGGDSAWYLDLNKLRQFIGKSKREMCLVFGLVASWMFFGWYLTTSHQVLGREKRLDSSFIQTGGGYVADSSAAQEVRQRHRI